MPEDDPLWPLVTSTRENCLGKERCEHWENCFVRAAREKALKSQIVVVNHHLFLSSLALKREANGQIDGMLPAADLTVIDEAHQLPGIATDFFGTTFTTWQLESIADAVMPMTARIGMRSAMPFRKQPAILSLPPEASASSRATGSPSRPLSASRS